MKTLHLGRILFVQGLCHYFESYEINIMRLLISIGNYTEIGQTSQSKVVFFSTISTQKERTGFINKLVDKKMNRYILKLLYCYVLNLFSIN